MTGKLPSALLPTACFPDIEYFVWLLFSERVSIESQETFPKQTCRNRYRISTANGILTLTVPVIKPAGNHTPTYAIQVDLKENWNRIHWRAIESAYNKSPFFLYYRDDFEKILMNPPVKLIELNLEILRLCCKFAGISPVYDLSETFVKEPQHMIDMRQLIMPKQPVRHEYTIHNFEPYIQVFSDRYAFIPNLSILDLLFNLGPDAGNYLKRHKPLVEKE
jgi:hypothetical protein